MHRSIGSLLSLCLVVNLVSSASARNWERYPQASLEPAQLAPDSRFQAGWEPVEDLGIVGTRAPSGDWLQGFGRPGWIAAEVIDLSEEGRPAWLVLWHDKGELEVYRPELYEMDADGMLEVTWPPVQHVWHAPRWGVERDRKGVRLDLVQEHVTQSSSRLRAWYRRGERGLVRERAGSHDVDHATGALFEGFDALAHGDGERGTRALRRLVESGEQGSLDFLVLTFEEAFPGSTSRGTSLRTEMLAGYQAWRDAGFPPIGPAWEAPLSVGVGAPLEVPERFELPPRVQAPPSMSGLLGMGEPPEISPEWGPVPELPGVGLPPIPLPAPTPPSGGGPGGPGGGPGGPGGPGGGGPRPPIERPEVTPGRDFLVESDLAGRLRDWNRAPFWDDQEKAIDVARTLKAERDADPAGYRRFASETSKYAEAAPSGKGRAVITEWILSDLAVLEALHAAGPLPPGETRTAREIRSLLEVNVRKLHALVGVAYGDVL